MKMAKSQILNSILAMAHVLYNLSMSNIKSAGVDNTSGQISTNFKDNLSEIIR